MPWKFKYSFNISYFLFILLSIIFYVSHYIEFRYLALLVLATCNVTIEFKDTSLYARAVRKVFNIKG